MASDQWTPVMPSEQHRSESEEKQFLAGEWLGHSPYLGSNDALHMRERVTESKNAGDWSAFEQGFVQGSAKQIAVEAGYSLQHDARQAYPIGLNSRGAIDYDFINSIDRSMTNKLEVIYGANSQLINGARHNIVSDPQFQKALPELALEELAHKFHHIHDDQSSDQSISLEELKTYASRNDVTGLEKTVVDYTLNHFDRIRQFDPVHQLHGKVSGITETAITNGIQNFAKLEMEKENLPNSAAVKLQPTLEFLSRNFDDILKLRPESKDADSAGINKTDLERFMGRCATEEAQVRVQEAESKIDRIKEFDTDDGKPVWGTLGYVHYNDTGITRRDIEAGLTEAKRVPERAAQIDAMLKSW